MGVGSAHWDDVVAAWPTSRSYAFLRSYNDHVNRSLLERWLPPDSRQLLKTDVFDEAVGVGLVPLLRSRARAVVGVDVSSRAVAASRLRYPDLNAETGDVRALGYQDESFDAIVSNSTLDHFASFAEIEQGVVELYRVLEHGGTLVLTLDNGQNPLVALRNAFPASLLRRWDLVPFFVGATCGPRRLRRTLEQAGFVVEETGAVMHFPRVVARVAAKLVAAPPNGRLMRFLLAFEALGRLPSRYLTGQFVAARAVKR